MTKRTQIGGNSPPNPIDQATAPYADAIEEATNWLDGTAVETEGQMKAVDDLTKQIKAALKDVKLGQKSESAPHFDAHKAAIARWKPTIDDLDMLADCLVAANSPFKAKLAAEKAEVERLANLAAMKARQEAERKAREADAGDIEGQREAKAAQEAAQEAQKQAQDAKKDGVKGLRNTHLYEINDHKKALHWIAVNDRDAMTVFIEDYIHRNHKARQIDGVRQWTEKRAF